MAESHGEAKGPGTGTAAHTAAEGGTHAFPPFQADTFASQLLSLALAFGALYLIVSRVALPRVGAAIEARQKKIDGDMSEAQRYKDQSEAALKAYEADLHAARSRAQAIGNENRAKLNAAAEAERHVLEEQLSQKLAAAEKSIAATRAAAMTNVRDIASEAAASIVQRLSGVAPDRKSVDAAVDATLKG